MQYEELLSEAVDLRSKVVVLREALKLATHELKAIRARDGAPQHIEWDRGRPMQISSCTDEWWNDLTEKCSAVLTETAEEGGKNV